MRTLMLAMAWRLAIAPCAWATGEPAIEINDAWARPTFPHAESGVVYLTVISHASEDDTLTSLSTPVAKTAELHETKMQNGIMSMTPLADAPVKSGGKLEIKPGGMHVMLMGLEQQLSPGKTFPLTATFAKAGPITVTVTVSMTDPVKAEP